MTPELILALCLTAADASQTEYIAQHPKQQTESNAVLGFHPSQVKVAAYFAATSGGLIVANQFLPKEMSRALNYVWIGVEGGAISRNVSLHVRFSI